MPLPTTALCTVHYPVAPAHSHAHLATAASIIQLRASCHYHTTTRSSGPPTMQLRDLIQDVKGYVASNALPTRLAISLPATPPQLRRPRRRPPITDGSRFWQRRGPARLRFAPPGEGPVRDERGARSRQVSAAVVSTIKRVVRTLATV